MVNSSLHIPRMFVSRGRARVSSLKCIVVAGVIQRVDERYICMKEFSFCWLCYQSCRWNIKLHSTFCDRSLWDKFVIVNVFISPIWGKCRFTQRYSKKISNFRNYLYIIKNKFYSYFYNNTIYVFMLYQVSHFEGDHWNISTVVRWWQKQFVDRLKLLDVEN